MAMDIFHFYMLFSLMNIGFFSECWDPQINGVVTSAKNLRSELIKKGNSVCVFAPRYDDFCDSDAYIFRQYAIKYFFQPEFNFASPFNFQTLRQARNCKLDLIHSHTEFSLGLVALQAATRLNIPLVFTMHTLWEHYSHYFFWDIFPRNLVRYFLSLLYKSPAYFIVPSRKVKSYLENTLKVKPTVRIIPTGLSLDHFFAYEVTPQNKIDFRRKYGLQASDVIMLFVGRIGKEKSIDVLVSALPQLRKKYPALKLLLVGGGPGISFLKKLAGRLGVKQHVVFTGYIPWEHIPLAYKSADMFVLASRSETQGLVTIEALASGLPVIVRKDPANLDVIENGKYGLVFDKGAEFISQVDLLLGSKQVKKSLELKAKEAVLKYSAEEFGNRVLEYYNWIIEDYHKKMAGS